ncbi:MAG: YvcK family protein, partial [Actinobacteria bacterium]|nr:YvcK family protein [Actinomycetota bacterium]
RAALPAREFVQVGVADAHPAPGVLDAIAEADVVLLAPSNPVVSIGTILAVPGIRDAVAKTPAPVVGVSPIVGGRAVRGMADACLSAIDVPVSAVGVAGHYGSRRSRQGVLDGWLVHPGDGGAVEGVSVREAPLMMTDDDATAEMVRRCLELAGV